MFGDKEEDDESNIVEKIHERILVEGNKRRLNKGYSDGNQHCPDSWFKHKRNKNYE